MPRVLQLKVCSTSQVILRSRNSIQKFSKGGGKKIADVRRNIFRFATISVGVLCVISLRLGWCSGVLESQYDTSGALMFARVCIRYVHTHTNTESWPTRSRLMFLLFSFDESIAASLSEHSSYVLGWGPRFFVHCYIRLLSVRLVSG